MLLRTLIGNGHGALQHQVATETARLNLQAFAEPPPPLPRMSATSKTAMWKVMSWPDVGGPTAGTTNQTSTAGNPPQVASESAKTSSEEPTTYRVSGWCGPYFTTRKPTSSPPRISRLQHQDRNTLRSYNVVDRNAVRSDNVINRNAIRSDNVI
ncbi:hypothetical protein BD410DRAFT_797659, partial [Rickenella mellea]